ncbi:MAG: M3 family metallopeptidase [Deltaproteobacteria bacterium]|nr:M3 family metallopeptidase [Deltaproteobacteria bacterium]
MSIPRTFVRLSSLTLAAGVFVGCATSSTSPDADQTAATAGEKQKEVANAENPLFQESTLAYKMPHFDRIKDEHFLPAFEKGMSEHLAEIDVVIAQKDAPTFDNTFIPMQKAGGLLNRTARVFFALIAADTNDTLEKVRTEMAPRLAAHEDAILLNTALFARIKTVYDAREGLNLDAESLRLVELSYRDFVRAGANLSDADKEKLKAINAEQATLQTQFSQNVLKEVNDLAIIVDDRASLAGLSDGAIAAAAAEAKKRKLDDKFVIALLNTSGQPALSALTDRALRQRIHQASLSRGSRGGEFDNRTVLTKMVKLRADRAHLLGYENHAAYSLETQTALTTDAVNKRLVLLAPAAVANAQQELIDLEKMAKKDGVSDFSSWDWSYYTEKVRQERYNFDASQLRPYFELDTVLQQGAFFAATKLYGITFKERTDLPTYHDDVRVFEVFNEDGSELALFLFDPYARASKRGGAWMNAYVSQSGLLGEKPVVANHLNVPKPAKDAPALMTFDEVTTLFHEFGHALHGMFSNVRYPEFAGTNVPRDFVEYPSQVNEMWSVWPEVLQNYAKHHETGALMPTELLEKVLATQTFNQGFATTEYLAASLLDQAWHQLKPDEVPSADDALKFEEKALEKAGVKVSQVPPRYRSMYFSHIMGGYSAGYYAYIWSEVLDADTVEWFKENGGLTRKNGDHFRLKLLSRGGATDAMKVFVEFRGKDPAIEPLLKRRGLDKKN